MKKILIILILGLFICGCNGQISDKKMTDLMKENEYIIIDVRTNSEYNSAHIVGAINIPYDEINEDIEIDKNKIVFVYCQSGNRSKYAYEVLTKLGYTTYDLGGYEEIDLEKTDDKKENKS